MIAQTLLLSEDRFTWLCSLCIILRTENTSLLFQVPGITKNFNRFTKLGHIKDIKDPIPHAYELLQL